ncbi:MAG: hypothetical protein WD080_08325 [Egibacteraceae bacterium]
MSRAPSAALPAAETVRARDNLIVLLSATDPLGLIARGHSAVDYAATASAALDVLVVGGRADELFGLFHTTDAPVETVHTFVRTAIHWWDARPA